MTDAVTPPSSRAVVLARWRELMGEDATPGAWIAGSLVAEEGEEVVLVDPARGMEVLRYRNAGARLAAEAARAADEGLRAWSRLTAAACGRLL